MTRKFSDLKFQVTDENNSASIQRQLFSCGYSWGDLYKPYIHGEQVRNTEYRFLYACTDGQIRMGYGYAKDVEIFNKSDAKLMTLSSLIDAVFYDRL